MQRDVTRARDAKLKSARSFDGHFTCAIGFAAIIAGYDGIDAPAIAFSRSCNDITLDFNHSRSKYGRSNATCRATRDLVQLNDPL